MARPRPKITLSHTDEHWIEICVLVAPVLYQVVYQGKSFGLRRESRLSNAGRKYPRTSFSNPAHAYNLRDQLNAIFHTDEFSVLELV